MDLILITQSYPYLKAGEQTFLNQELPFLIKSFGRIFIIPKEVGGEKVDFKSDKVTVVEEYARTKPTLNRKMILGEIAFYKRNIWQILVQEIIWTPGILINAKKALVMLSSIYQSNEFYWFIKKFIKENNINILKSRFYTYWFQETTTGLALLKIEDPNITIITRVHNIDLYKERHPFDYIPFRKTIIKTINGIFPCMDAGTKYLRKNYKCTNSVLKTSYLGVDDHGFINQPSDDNIFRILSCSSIIQIKRLNLIVEAIKELIKIRPKTKIEWIHFGDGILKNEILSLTDTIEDEYVNIIFMGHVSIAQIIAHYKNHPVDVFINVSSFEGQPVSIKEAISVGIPIIATDVGGNSEIVTKNNGILLTSNPVPSEIAETIIWFIDNPNEARVLRKNSRKLFLEKYDSIIVYSDFVKIIKEISNSGNNL